MHYKGFVITKEIPSIESLDKILSKYYYENENNNLGFTWDWWEIGGRYGGKIKMNFNPNKNEDSYFCFKERNNKYFISQAINNLKNKLKFFDELDWLIYMGLRENKLYVDGAYFKDIINFDITDCYLVIDDKEKLYIREKWNGANFIKDNNFDKKVKKINLQNKFIVIIDFHD